jgi:hypothetical protein
MGLLKRLYVLMQRHVYEVALDHPHQKPMNRTQESGLMMFRRQTKEKSKAKLQNHAAIDHEKGNGGE